MITPSSRILCKNCIYYRGATGGDGECHIRSAPDVLRREAVGSESRDPGWPRRKAAVDFCGEAVTRKREPAE